MNGAAGADVVTGPVGPDVSRDLSSKEQVAHGIS